MIEFRNEKQNLDFKQCFQWCTCTLMMNNYLDKLSRQFCFDMYKIFCVRNDETNARGPNCLVLDGTYRDQNVLDIRR